MIPLTKEEKKIHREQKNCYICKKRFSTHNDNKKYYKVRDHCHFTGKYRRAAHNIRNLRYKTPKEISVLFYYGSTYDYHFIIKELAEEFEGQFECLGENTDKYITSSLPIKKVLDNGKSVTYKMKFIDSFRFMFIDSFRFIIYLKDFIVISSETVNLVLIICQSKMINGVALN